MPDIVSNKRNYAGHEPAFYFWRMLVNIENYNAIKAIADEHGATVVAVSKTKPVEAILELYNIGHRDFGENYVQELVEKQAALPQDIRWHFIGHLQSNKVKYIAPFVHLIHGVDSFKLLKEIDKQAAKVSRIIAVLLQVHIAQEETKYGLSDEELKALLSDNDFSALINISVQGLMGMSSFSADKTQVRKEFNHLRELFMKNKQPQTTNYKPQTLSMGMSGDYAIALEEGSNLIRVGSSIFGSRK